MKPPRLTQSELAILKPLWEWGTASIRDIWVAFPEHTRPAYTTVQTTMRRLETKRVVRRFAKVRKAHVFAPMISREIVLRQLIDDSVALVEGRKFIVVMYLLDGASLPEGSSENSAFGYLGATASKSIRRASQMSSPECKCQR